METAGKLAGFAVCAALVALILRRLRPEAGWGVSLGAGAIVLLAALPALSALVRGIASLSAMSGLDDSFMQQLLKIAGLSLLLDFAAQTCRDAQEEALALKVEFAGRVLLFPFRPRARSWALRERPAPFCPAEPDICLPCRGNWMLLSARRGCS